MTTDHTCLPLREDPWDCPACRAVLYEITSVEGKTASLIPLVLTPVLPDGCPPLLGSPFDRLHEATPEPEEEQHITTEKVVPNGGPFPGGRWFASCTCGWTAFGRYTRDDAKDVAFTLTRMKAAEHVADPDRHCAYCGNPHRLAMCNFCKFDKNQGHG